MQNTQTTTLMICLVVCVQAWERLERAEHERERVLRDELIRQEKLEQMARRFDRKAAMRETWLQENQRLVAQVKHYGSHDVIIWYLSCRCLLKNILISILLSACLP